MHGDWDGGGVGREMGRRQVEIRREEMGKGGVEMGLDGKGLRWEVGNGWR